MSEHRCKWCHEELDPDDTAAVFCSKRCRDEYKRHQVEEEECAPADIEITTTVRMKFNNKSISTWRTGGFRGGPQTEALERDGYHCYICGKPTNLHVHHIIPREEGGPHTLDNLITLCGGCHRSIEAGNVENAIKKCVKRALVNWR
jgi:hypothetical protein